MSATATSEQWLWHGPDRLERASAPAPRPRPGHVVLAVHAVGICGTDLHLIEGLLPGVAPPAPLGHEVAGEVIAVGEDVRRVAVGDRCCVDPLTVCGRCVDCLEGAPQHCREGAEIGIDVAGGWQTLLELPERNCWPLPRDVSMAVGSQAEPLHVVLGALDRVGPKVGERALVIGDGAIGLYFTALLLRGGVHVTLAGLRERRLALARRWGARAVNVAEADLAAELDGPPQVVVEAVGAAETVEQAIALARPGGRVVLFGLPTQSRLPVDVFRVVMREITLVGGSNAPAVWPRIAELLADMRSQVEEVITDVVPFDALPEGLARAAEPDRAIKVVVDVAAQGGATPA